MNVNARDLLPNDVIEDKVVVQYYKDSAKWHFPETTKTYEIVELAHSRNLPFSKAFEFTTLKENDSNSLEELDLIVGLHQYIYNVGENTVHLNWKINNESHLEELKPGDSAYIKPNVPHNFRSKGKLMVLRIAGRVAGDAQRELSSLDKNDAHRAISEVSMWFDPLEKTSTG
jgi:methylphosphonate synthase